MKNVIPFFSLILMFFGCQNNSNDKINLEGDLYFTWLKLGSFYEQPDSVYQSYVKLVDSLGIEELRRRNPKETEHIELLEKHDLLHSPFIYLISDSDSIFIVYMSKKDYEPITHYSYQNLINSEEKIRLKLVTEKLNDKLRVCRKVVSIEKIKGKTFQEQKKFKVEDYK